MCLGSFALWTTPQRPDQSQCPRPCHQIPISRGTPAELNRVHAVTLVGSAGSVVHTTPLTTTQAGIVAACQVPAPAVVTALDPA